VSRMLDTPRRGPAVRVFLLAFFVYAYFLPRWADWNIDSRFDLTRAIVDVHSLRIDRFHFNTWDKAVSKGHFYSDKAPGTAVLGAVVYAGYAAAKYVPLLRRGITDAESNSLWNVAIRLGRTSTQKAPAPKGTNLGGCQRAGGGGNVQYIPWGNRLYPPFRDWALSKYVTTVGAVALTSAGFLAFFFWFLGFFTRRSWIRWAVTLAYGFATVALPYSTVFYSHQISAGCLFTAFGLLYLYNQRAVGMPGIVTAGFLLGFAFFTEYTVALVIITVGLYGLWAVRRRIAAAASFVGAGMVPVLALFAYNKATFGSPLDTGYSHDFCWSAAQGVGYAGFTRPQSGPLFDLTFGPYRGLFYTSPFLLLALVGGLIMVRRGLKLESLLCIGTAVIFILVISAYWGWNGGQVDGPRYLVPIVPFLAFPVVFYLDALARNVLAVTVFLVILVWSLFATWASFLGGELFPHSWMRYPLENYSLPALGRNEIAPNFGMFFGLTGWHSLIPLVVAVVVISFSGLPLVPRRAHNPVPLGWVDRANI
jgi:hypothetical protein